MRYPNAEAVTHREFFGTPADVFVPAALEKQITAVTAPWLKVRLVVEAANGPTDVEGDTILSQNGIELLPDILCNSGGVIVSYFEWLQNQRHEAWDIDNVDERLRKMITSAYRNVRQAEKESVVDPRTAAYLVALKRLERVYSERGIFP